MPQWSFLHIPQCTRVCTLTRAGHTEWLGYRMCTYATLSRPRQATLPSGCTSSRPSWAHPFHTPSLALGIIKQDFFMPSCWWKTVEVWFTFPWSLLGLSIFCLSVIYIFSFVNCILRSIVHFFLLGGFSFSLLISKCSTNARFSFLFYIFKMFVISVWIAF